MRPNLSVHAFASTLAALGAGALIGCGGSDPAPQTPVNATQVAPAPVTVTGQASCSAASCGANKAAAATPATAPAAAASPADTAAAAAPATAAAAGAAASATPAAAPADATAAATPADAKPKKKTGKKPPTNGAGQASCGAGTCSADAKKTK
jgi:hypothetical protein